MTTGLFHNGLFLAPWPLVSSLPPSGPLVYYTPPKSLFPCLPAPSYPLIRHELPASALPSLLHDSSTPSNAAQSGQRVLLIVNPTSGTAAPHLTEQRVAVVRTILLEAALIPTVCYTEKRGHAVELLHELGTAALRDFAAVVAVGGDGTLHEVLNGLVTAVRGEGGGWEGMPALAVVPGGSGNAVALSGGVVSAWHAGLNVVAGLRDGAAVGMAVMEYRGRGGEERVVVGGVQWGLPAEVDCGTEAMRFLGDVRFDLGAVAHIARRRTVHGRMRIAVDGRKQREVRERIENGWRESGVTGGSGGGSAMESGEVGEGEYVLEGQFAMVVAWNCALIGDGFMVTPFASATETGVFDVVVVPGEVSRATMLGMMVNCKDGTFVRKVRCFQYFKATRLEFEEIDGRFLTVDGEQVPVEPFVLQMAPENGHVRILDAFSEAPMDAFTFV